MIKLKYINKKEQVLSREFTAINFHAGNDGCGAWRMIWPAHAINMTRMGVVYESLIPPLTNLAPMIVRSSSIRMQRYVSVEQAEFFKQICKERDALNSSINLIYEVDDIIFRNDIPDYNEAKPNFLKNYDEDSAKFVIENCDEMTVVSEYMKDYYLSKTNQKRITVVPNFLPQWWIDGYFDVKRILENYERFKLKPRILYAGSPTHISYDINKKHIDDFTKINDIIRKTSKKFQWVFFGGLPPALQDLHKNGTIEYHPWVNILDFPKTIWDLRVNATIAPLTDNLFNRAKSNIKLTESGCFGLPGVYQDINPYKNAFFKFNTPEEMIDQLDVILKSENKYKNYSIDSYNYSKKFMMKDNMECYREIYSSYYNDPRPNLDKWQNL